MGFSDFLPEWEAFKQHRKKLVPYEDELKMHEALKMDSPHFFPSKTWWIVILFASTFLTLGLFSIWISLILVGSIFYAFLPMDIFNVTLVCGGSSLIIFGVSRHHRIMTKMIADRIHGSISLMRFPF